MPGIKSENVYGKTFGCTSYASAAGTFDRGIEPPVQEKFRTTGASTLIDHSAQQHATVAQIVGIQREQDTYAKVSSGSGRPAPSGFRRPRPFQKKAVTDGAREI